jgi:hypothetical protein
MVKANDLIIEQKKRENKKYNIYYKIYLKIEKKINLASATNYYYVWYEVPLTFLGNIYYKFIECIEYILTKLLSDGFETEYFEPNILLIKWFPK